MSRMVFAVPCVQRHAGLNRQSPHMAIGEVMNHLSGRPSVLSKGHPYLVPRHRFLGRVHALWHRMHNLQLRGSAHRDRFLPFTDRKLKIGKIVSQIFAHTVSPRTKSSRLSRSRTTRHTSPEINTSATLGREL